MWQKKRQPCKCSSFIFMYNGCKLDPMGKWAMAHPLLILYPWCEIIWRISSIFINTHRTTRKYKYPTKQSRFSPITGVCSFSQKKKQSREMTFRQNHWEGKTQHGRLLCSRTNMRTFRVCICNNQRQPRE